MSLAWATSEPLTSQNPHPKAGIRSPDSNRAARRATGPSRVSLEPGCLRPRPGGTRRALTLLCESHVLHQPTVDKLQLVVWDAAAEVLKIALEQGLNRGDAYPALLRDVPLPLVQLHAKGRLHGGRRRYGATQHYSPLVVVVCCCAAEYKNGTSLFMQRALFGRSRTRFLSSTK